MLLFGLLLYPETQAFFFPCLHIQYAVHDETPNGWFCFMSSIDWSIKDVPLLFSPGVIEMYNLPVLAASSKQQTLAGDTRSSVPDIPPCPFPIYPLPVRA